MPVARISSEKVACPLFPLLHPHHIVGELPKWPVFCSRGLCACHYGRSEARVLFETMKTCAFVT